MKIAEVIVAQKTNVTFGAWRDDKPRKRDFPMSKRRRGGAFPLTRKWRWCTVEFDALGRKFITMVAYHRDLPEYQAVLAERLPDDTRTLARFEYHGAHPVPGWHIHAACGDVNDLELGVTKPLGQNRIPEVRSKHRRGDFVSEDDSMNDDIALKLAAERYGVPYTPNLFGHVST